VTDFDDTCPHCGASFHCGFDDAEPCSCTMLQLDAAALAKLRQRYKGCLCLACLRALAAQPPSDQSVAP